MLRFLNVLTFVCLLGSAGYAYSVKYETIYRAEQIAKLEREIKAERDAIAVLRAEWAYATRPDRIQTLADKYLDLVVAKPIQVLDIAILPERSARVDVIGRKLEELGLSEPTNTPKVGEKPGATPAGGR